MEFELTANHGIYRCGVCKHQDVDPLMLYERLSEYIVRCSVCSAIGLCACKQLNNIAWKTDFKLIDWFIERGIG